MIKFSDENNLIDIDYASYKSRLSKIVTGINDKSIEGSDFLGWIDVFNNSQHVVDEVINENKRLRKLGKTMVVIGIGGSYLGAKAVDDAIYGQNLATEYKLLFVGNSISSHYIDEIYNHCLNNDFVLNVISKSGSTLESALSFRIFKKLLIEKYGEEGLKERLVITTDPSDGKLREFANKHDYTSFNIPSDVGGRYSVFTAVGLIPLAFGGIDIEKFLKGGADASKQYLKDDINNDAFKYALNRYILNEENGFAVEALISYRPSCRYLIEWIKQLYGESEGKNSKGLLPVGFIYSTDLHSLGQFVQDGSKILFETLFKINNSKRVVDIPLEEDDFDGLNRIVAQNSMHDIKMKTMSGVINAHTEGGVPNLVIEMEYLDDYTIGYLMSFLMYSCMYTAYLLELNPFDQPGVEIYKREMYKLL
ncbi:MAG: glucose-6-phosphate isomerase [Erysipelotrichales bacterium]